MTTHLLIPDCQVKEGDPVDHLTALGNYIVEKKPDVIINIGDFADMASLSSFEKPGSKYFEGKSYKQDINSARHGMNMLLNPMRVYNNKMAYQKRKQYHPRMVLTLGNHEHRITRAINDDPTGIGSIISLQDLSYEKDWEVYPFLNIVVIDGVAYSHYFVNPDALTGKPIGGTINNKLIHLGCSFTMGHQQHNQYGTKYTALGKAHHGLVSGAYYQHDEPYMGPQKNTQHWRGVVMKHEVEDGTYDPMFVSLKFLKENYL